MDTRYEEEVFLEFENFEAEATASFYVGFDYNPGGFDEPPGYYLENCKLEDFEVIGYTKEGDFLELTKEQVNQVDEKLKEYVEVHEDEIFVNALEQMKKISYRKGKAFLDRRKNYDKRFSKVRSG